MPSFCVREHPARVEPHRERRARPIEDRPCRHRRPVAAAGAPDPSVARPPAATMTALLAHEPIGPAQPCEMVEVLRVSSEPHPELPQWTGDGAHRQTGWPFRESSLVKWRPRRALFAYMDRTGGRALCGHRPSHPRWVQGRDMMKRARLRRRSWPDRKNGPVQPRPNQEVGTLTCEQLLSLIHI